MSSSHDKTYDWFFSMGAACPTALTLKAVGLRSNSGPFDWNGIVDFKKRVDLLVGKEPFLLESDQWEYQGRREAVEPRSIYKNCRNNLLFPHDFPLDMPIDKAKQIVVDRYMRRFERLKQILAQDKRVLAVYMSTVKPEPFDLEELKKDLKRLNDYYTATIDTLYIRHNPKCPKGTHSITYQDDSITVVECCLRDGDHPMEDETIQQIFKDYHSVDENKNKKWLKHQRLKRKIKRWFINQRYKGDDVYYRILGFKYRPKKK